MICLKYYIMILLKIKKSFKIYITYNVRLSSRAATIKILRTTPLRAKAKGGRRTTKIIRKEKIRIGSKNKTRRGYEKVRISFQRIVKWASKNSR